MQRLKLDLPGLRARQLAILAQKKNFTRREFIGLTGTAALGAAAQAKTLSLRLPGSLKIVGDENRLAFLLGDEERWVIDPRRFSGSPKLSIERTETRLRFELSRARYPGTNLPADLTGELNRIGRRWRLHLRMTLGGFDAKIPFEQWLAGNEAAVSGVRLQQTVSDLGRSGRVLASGNARATFNPGWTLDFRGTKLSRVLGVGRGILSDSLNVALLEPNAASLLGQPAAKRTLISLPRGQREWQLTSSLTLPAGAQFKSNEDPFDAIQIEAGESRNGAPLCALVAEPATDDSKLSFHPSGDFKGVFGEVFSLPLRGAILAATFAPKRDERILLAQFDRDPVWLQSQQFVVELGDTPDEIPFTLTNDNGRFAHLHCAPALRSAAFHLEGAVVQPTPCEEGSRLIFDVGTVSDDAVSPPGLDPQQRPTPTPTPTPRRIGPIRIPPNILARPTPTPTPSPTPTRRPPVVRPQPDQQATPTPTPNPGIRIGPITIPIERPTPRPRPTPRSTPTPSETPIFVPPRQIERATPSPTPAFEKPPTGVISVRPENLGQLNLRGRFSTLVLRPEDLLVLRLEFLNLSLDTGAPNPGERSVPHLVRDNTLRPSYIVVYFPGQNIAEQAFFETAPDYPVQTPPGKPADPDAGTEDKTPKPPPVKARLAGPSRLVFRVPNEEKPIDYTLASILEKCGKYELSVVPHALPPKTETNFVIIPSQFLLATAIDNAGVKPVRMASAQKVIQQARVNSATIIPGKNLAAVQKEDLAIKAIIAANAGIAVRPPKPRKPEDNETALELPYLLILSPNIFGGWAHAQLPVTSQKAKRTELWHTRLGVRTNSGVDEQSEALRTVRAVWTLDPGFHDDAFSPPPHANDPFRMSLDADDRYNLVHLSSNYTISLPAIGGRTTRGIYDPNPVRVERLMLSSMGAWINSRGVWEPPNPLTIEEWRQRGTMGRDHYVRVVYKGYLFPFGHRASLVKITERKFHNNLPGNPAYLRQRMFIIVREPETTYGNTGLTTPGPDDHSYDRQMPFRRVRITTLVTPNLNKPEDSDLGGLLQSLFWPRVGSADFQFHLIAEDFEGHEIEFTTPLLFADQAAAKDSTKMVIAQADFETSGPDERRKRDLRGQKLMLADSSKPGDTTFETQTITFGAEIPTIPQMSHLGADSPQFYPAVRRAELIIPSLKHIADNHQAGEIKFADAYLKFGLNDVANNHGQLFGEFVSGIDLNFSGKGDKSGALVTPNMKISGLSRVMGPVAGDVTKVVAGGFDPKDFFAGLSPQIFGCIDLFNLIGGVDPGNLLDKIDLVPKFVTEALNNIEAFLVEVQNFQNTLKSISGSVGGLQSTVDALINDAKTIIETDLPDIVKPPFDTIDAKLAKLSSDLSTFQSHFATLGSGLPGANIADGAKRELQKNIALFNHYLADATSFINDVKAFAGAIPTELPKEIKVKFDWKPKMTDWGFDASHPLFIAKNGSTPCTLLIGVEVRVKTDGK